MRSLHFGVGLAQGAATLGAIGFEGRWDYGAIGPVSNLAARLSSEAKAGQILVSRTLLKAVDRIVTAEPVGELTLKGFDEYARNQLGAKPTRPSQPLFFVHPVHGVTARWSIYVDKPGKPASDDWVSVFDRKAA